jgi:hypothetical protein
LPVLVAVQPFGAAPTASASKVTVLSAMALTSTEQKSAAAMRMVFIVVSYSLVVVPLEIVPPALNRSRTRERTLSFG